MKIKLVGIHNIPCYKAPEENKDYLLSLKVSLEEERWPKGLGEKGEPLYVMRVLNPEQFLEMGGKEIRIEKGTTPSQIQRFKLKDMFRRGNIEDTEENYQLYMKKIGEWIDKQYIN